MLFPVPEKEWAAYSLDQKINDRGVRVDAAFVQKAQLMGETVNRELMDKGPCHRDPKPTFHCGNGKVAARPRRASEDLRRKSLQKLAGQSEESSSKGFPSVWSWQTIKFIQIQRHSAGHECRRAFTRAVLPLRRPYRPLELQIRPAQNLPQNHLQDLDAARDLVIAGDIQGIRGKNRASYRGTV